MFHCHQIKGLQGLLWSTLIYFFFLVGKYQFSLIAWHWWFFFWDKNKIGMRGSSILLQRHRSLWGSNAFVVICLGFLLAVCGQAKSQIRGSDLRLFGGWFRFGFWGVCLCFGFILLFFFLCCVDEALQERIRFREIWALSMFSDAGWIALKSWEYLVFFSMT